MVKVFGKREIAAWEQALAAERPISPVEMDWPTFPQVVSLAPAAMTVGMAIRLKMRDGSETAFAINPVAARHMAFAIFEMGRQAGWLDEEYSLTEPSFDFDS